MKDTLSLDLRPKTFGELFGQKKVVDAILSQVETKRLPRAWLFAGETGSGKTTIARIIAVSLNCTHGKFGYPCADCYAHQAQFQIIEHNASSLNGVDAIKELAVHSSNSPLPGTRRRVFILDEAQRLSRAAQNVLLKYFEDIPRTSVWIIATTDPQEIIRPLRARCYGLKMQPLRSQTVEKFVRWAALQAKIKRSVDPFIEFVHRNDVTSPRILLFALEKYAAGLDPEDALADSDANVDTKRICQALTAGEWNPIRSELAKAVSDDVVGIRAAVLGYLCSIILDHRPSLKVSSVAAAIRIMSRATWNIEGRSQLAVLAADLHEACRKL